MSGNTRQLLILSNSVDGTADILVGLCEERGQPVFRFNIDLWLDYRFLWTPEGLAITDPTGRVLESDEVDACLWRRPSLKDTPNWRGGTAEDRAATEAELHFLVREIADWARARGVLRLMEPGGSRRVGRIAQMRVARDFFSVPDWAVGWGMRLPPGRRVVKRFVPEALGAIGDRYIFVKSVEADRLSPDWPWLTQEVARGSHDATVVYVAGRCFGFEMAAPRAELGAEDWRRLIGSGRDQWRTWEMPEGFVAKIKRYMERLGLFYGRLDFLTGDGDPDFLEVNPTGQFGWLDDPAAGWMLHGAVLDAALDPRTTIYGNEMIRELPDIRP